MIKSKREAFPMMDEEILRVLRENPSEFVSGEEISRRLKVTRTAIWKRINGLRALGYEVEASRRLGYRLLRSPDLLSPSELKGLLNTKWMGHVIHYFQVVDSTNAEAYQLAVRGAGEGEIVIAESQTKGRGRLGRDWFSPPYLNLYLSAVLRPSMPPHQTSLITLMAAVAVAEAVEEFSGLRPTIKWPNDLLMGNRKLAGLLNEIQSETDRIHFVILGIGMNLNIVSRHLPRKLRPLATSLKMETGGSVSRKEFVRCLLGELETWYETLRHQGGAPILEAWREWAQIRGRPVQVTSFGERLTGTAIDVDSEGRLILETRDGQQKRVVAGDVEYRE